MIEGDKPRELQDYASPKAGAEIRALVDRPSTLTAETVTRQMGTAFDSHRFIKKFTSETTGIPSTLSFPVENGYESFKLYPEGVQQAISARHGDLRQLEGKQYGDDVMAAFRAETPTEQVIEEWQPTRDEDFYGEPQDKLLARLDAQAEKDEHDIDTLYSQIDPLEQPHGDVPHDPAHDL